MHLLLASKLSSGAAVNSDIVFKVAPNIEYVFCLKLNSEHKRNGHLEIPSALSPSPRFSPILMVPALYTNLHSTH